MFKNKKKLYFHIQNDESDWLIMSSAKSLERWKKDGINGHQYYELDLKENRIIPVVMEIIVNNT